jgi:hypothetical protein
MADTIEQRAMAAIIRHEKARQLVDSLTRDIGISVGRCPIDKEALIQGHGDLWTQDQKHTKTHLWQAFQHLEPSSCGWGEVHLCDDGVFDALAEGSEFDCVHCYDAFKFIVARRAARKELGHARLSIRALGRSALRAGE